MIRTSHVFLKIDFGVLNSVSTLLNAHSLVQNVLYLQTWTDSAKLAEMFEEFKTRSLTDSSASKSRAPGNEVYVLKASGPSCSANGVPATNSVSKGGKNRWTCSCCKNLVCTHR